MAEASSELIALARYNAWANERVFTACSRLSDDQLGRAVVYGPTLELLRHLVHMQLNFLRMSQGGTRQPPPEADFASLRARVRELDAEYQHFLESAPDLERTLHVLWFGFDLSVREAMLQALTHSIKHRTDVCIALPALGVDAPALDFIE